MLNHRSLAAWTCLALFSSALAVGSARASLLGPGDIANSNNDTAFDLVLVDLSNSQALSAGTYQATDFNYQFNRALSSYTLGGSITPLIAIDDGSSGYQVIALGDTINYVGDTPWTTTSFGGSDSFTLTSAATIYGGLYWGGASAGERMPVGHFRPATTSDFIRYASASAPTVGSSISGGASGTFDRAYDFSIAVGAVPEPTTIVVWSMLGLTACHCNRRRRCPA